MIPACTSLASFQKSSYGNGLVINEREHKRGNQEGPIAGGQRVIVTNMETKKALLLVPVS
jgi:hypothetical protein